MWRLYVLRWALGGLKVYYQHRFQNIPQSCRSFIEKKSIMEDKDTVKEFLSSVVEEGTPKHFVKVKDLYNEYSETYRALQKDKKTYKNAGSFQSGVTRVLKKDVFAKKPAPTLSVRVSFNSWAFPMHHQVQSSSWLTVLRHLSSAKSGYVLSCSTSPQQPLAL